LLFFFQFLQLHDLPPGGALDPSHKPLFLTLCRLHGLRFRIFWSSNPFRSPDAKTRRGYLFPFSRMYCWCSPLTTRTCILVRAQGSFHGCPPRLNTLPGRVLKLRYRASPFLPPPSRVTERSFMLPSTSMLMMVSRVRLPSSGPRFFAGQNSERAWKVEKHSFSQPFVLSRYLFSPAFLLFS